MLRGISLSLAVALAATLAGGPGAAGQAPAPPAAPAANTGQAVILDQLRDSMSWNADGTGTSDLTASFQVLSDAGVQALAVLRFPYTRGSQTEEVVYVRVRQPGGGVIVTPASNIEEMPGEVTQNAPLYSDLREKHVVVTGLAVGDTLEYEVRTQIVHPVLPNAFWMNYTFVNAFVAKSEELDIAVPQGLAIHWDSPGLKPRIDTANGQTVYTWTYSHLSASDTAAAPEVGLNTFASWADVGAWYRGLERPQASVTPTIQAKAAALTAGLSGDQAKIEAIYHFVATHIHYVALDFGAGAYQPHPAADVLANGYGDCKDQVTLLSALLEAAGYQAWPALISSTGAKILTDVPSPAQFDHLIAVVQRGNGQKDWLDTTPGVAPYGMLMANLRNQQALVIPADALASLATTPADPPFPAAVDFEANGKLDAQGTLTAHVKESLRGDGAVLARLAFRSTPAASWPQVAQGMVQAEGFGGQVSNVKVSDPEDTSTPLVVSYDYTRSDYGDWSGQWTSAFLLPLTLTLPASASTAPIPLNAPGTDTLHSEIQFPSGYTPTLSQPVDLVNNWIEYHASYSFANGVLTSERTFRVKQDQAPASALAQLTGFQKAVKADEDAYMQLTSTAAGAVGSDSVEAVFEAGEKAAQNRDFDTASQKFQQVVKLRPRDPAAWSDLGYVYLPQMRWPEAVTAFRTAIRINPANSMAQHDLAVAYAGEHDLADAREQLEHELTLAPNDAMAATLLKKIRAAARPSDYAADLSDLETADSELKAGDNVKGLDTIQHTVVADPDPLVEMAAGYILASHRQDLDQAQTYVRTALAHYQAALHGVQLQDFQPAQLNDVSGLGVGWGILGRILYLKNDATDAEDYLQAAFNLDQDGEAADDLGQVYATLGRRADAERLFADALTEGGSRSAPADTRTHLEAMLSKDQATALIQKEAGALSASLRVEIPAAGLTAGSAAFLIAFDPGPKVDWVKFVSGDDALSAAVPALAAARYHVLFPGGVMTTLVQSAELDCQPQAAHCDFVLDPASSDLP